MAILGSKAQAAACAIELGKISDKELQKFYDGSPKYSEWLGGVRSILRTKEYALEQVEGGFRLIPLEDEDHRVLGDPKAPGALRSGAVQRLAVRHLRKKPGVRFTLSEIWGAIAPAGARSDLTTLYAALQTAQNKYSNLTVNGEWWQWED